MKTMQIRTTETIKQRFSYHDGNHYKKHPLPLPSDKGFLYYRAPTEVSFTIAL